MTSWDSITIAEFNLSSFSVRELHISGAMLNNEIFSFDKNKIRKLVHIILLILIGLFWIDLDIFLKQFN